MTQRQLPHEPAPAATKASDSPDLSASSGCSLLVVTFLMVPIVLCSIVTQQLGSVDSDGDAAVASDLDAAVDSDLDAAALTLMVT